MSKTIDMYSVIQNEETAVLHTECPTGILNSEESIPHATEDLYSANSMLMNTKNEQGML